jgi:glycosyltransferase involved in cell wall biosynthesis
MSAATAARSTYPHLRLATHPVRVCFMIDRLSRAGTETQLLALIRELDRTEVEPSLVLLDGEDDLSRALEPADCPVLRLGVRKLFSWPAVTAARRLCRFWHEYPPDVLQVYFLDAAYFATPLAKLCGIAKVVRVRNNLGYWLTPRHRLMNRLLQPWVDVTLTNSEEGKRVLVTTDRLRPERVVVLENGVDTHRFRRFMLPDTSKKLVRVGCVANLRPVKNIDGLMNAAQLALRQHPQLVFEVAGDGEERPALERRHAQLGLGERFILHGSVSDVPGFLRRMDIAVLPSHSEGMSNALLEYMAAGRAIIATDVGANRQLLDGGNCGLLVPPANTAALVDAITELLANPLRAANLGAAARRRVQELYSRQAMCQRFQHFYRGLANN